MCHEPDALSKLVSGGIFHVQNCSMLVGGCISLIPLDPPLPLSIPCKVYLNLSVSEHGCTIGFESEILHF